MIGNAGSADGQFGAIFSQNGEVQCTRKLQGTPLGSLTDTQGPDIGL